MITVFYARYAFLNPGFPLFLQSLHENPPPGVRAINVTEFSPDEVSGFAANSSTIAIDQSIENASTWAKPGELSIYRIRGNRPLTFFQEVSERLWSADARRVFISNFDLHDPRLPSLLEKMRGKVDAFSWSFEKRQVDWSDIPLPYRDPWLSPEHNAQATWSLVRSIAPVRIELPFSLAPGEFATTQSGLVWDACVPGAPYATRTLAENSIRRQGLSCAPARTIRLMGLGVSLLFGKTLPSERASISAIALQQQLQRALVRTSAMTFVCGSGVLYPTRKFFEVPGLLSPMLAYPCIGFRDYGFIDGENVVSTAPEDAGKNGRLLKSRPGLAARIAQSGQDMIRRLHGLEVRVAEFAECLRRVDTGTLKGAQFCDGRFEIY